MLSRKNHISTVLCNVPHEYRTHPSSETDTLLNVLLRK
jgi:hypothetical protein